MARIPEGEIERLKREVSLERLAEARGVKLKRHGADLIGLCPFHEDHSPSLVISPQKNLWNCLGACGKGGSVIDWVMRAEGVSFRHAVELLKQENLPLAAQMGGKLPQRSTVPKLPAPVSRDADDRALLLQVARYYHDTLKNSPDTQKYLEGRGLTSAEMIEHFHVGFANRTLGYGLPEKNRVAGAELRGRLQKLGILRESGHEHFNGSVVIPVFNREGDVVQMYGRKITPGLRPGTPLHLYLPGPHRGVWNEEALAASKEIILCEALIDALTFWCAGFRNVTASYGVNGFTDDHKAAFQKYGTQGIYIAYDRDAAGERAAEEHAGELLALGIECFRVQFPKGMDANEYALKVTPAAKSLGVLLNNAVWLGKGQRPTVGVIEPQIIEEKSEPAAKEKISETLQTNTQEENELPLAAESSERTEEVAPVPAMHALSKPLEVPVEINGDEVTITQGDRRYRVLGLEKNTVIGILRLNVLVTRDERLHVDTFDLYSSRHRMMYSKQAGEELGVKEEVVSRDLGRMLWKLEELQRQMIQKTLEPKEQEVTLSAEEKAEALGLLRDPRLLERILSDFERCGVVGEETNKLASYVAVVSRLLDAPLAILVQSSSAAGKSALMEAVLAMLPEEQRVQYSAMTGQSLFYMGETDLKHKVLAIVEEEGAARAAYALKLLQSEGVLSIASTGKDATTGRLITHHYRVEGPVMLFLTTTAIDLDEELLNRCLVLTVDEDRAQTQAIHKKQREAQTLEGLLARRERDETLRVHRNAQRLLKPLFVANPYARELTFLDSQTRTRRDHMKYLTLIRSIALLHQHQRPRKTVTHRGQALEYIEVTLDDISTANRLAHEVLGRSLDELPPQTKRLLLLTDEMVSAECARQKMEREDFRFSRKDVRRFTKWSDSQLKRHLHRLEELEYLLVHHGGRGQTFAYELVFERQDDSGKPMLPGLIEIEKLTGYGYDANKSDLEGEKSGPSLPQVRGVSGGGAGEESPALARRNGEIGPHLEKITTRANRENPVVHTAAGGR
jgi:DNA primase catalytic core